MIQLSSWRSDMNNFNIIPITMQIFKKHYRKVKVQSNLHLRVLSEENKKDGKYVNRIIIYIDLHISQ